MIDGQVILQAGTTIRDLRNHVHFHDYMQCLRDMEPSGRRHNHDRDVQIALRVLSGEKLYFVAKLYGISHTRVAAVTMQTLRLAVRQHNMKCLRKENA